MLHTAEAINELVQDQIKEQGLDESNIELLDVFSKRGIVSVKWIRDASKNALDNPKEGKLFTGRRSYQREVVSSLAWKQEIMRTVISNVLSSGYKSIPEVHIRLQYSNGKEIVPIYELVDGQQRITAILQFLNNEYPLAPTMEAIEGVTVAGALFDDLPIKVKNAILGYTIGCTWYVNLSDDKTSDLFINVLNNVNTMKHQEKRNAIMGALSDYIRNEARPDPQAPVKYKPHTLFAKTTNSDDGKTTMNFFSKKGFKLRGHMELDEWISEMIYFYVHGYEKGISQTGHTKWVTEQQKEGGNYKTLIPKKKHIVDLWDLGEKVLKAVAKDGRTSEMTPMVSQMIILFANEIQKEGNKIVDFDKYVSSWMGVYDKYSKPEVYTKTQAFDKDGVPMGLDLEGNPIQPLTRFKLLFGGKGQLAIANIRGTLKLEFNKNPSSWGTIEIDPRERFNDEDIQNRWLEVEKRDEYTGEPIALEDVAGDHNIPRSWGVEAGGVTEYHNLRVTSRSNNRRKSDKSGEQFMKILEEENSLKKAA